MAPPPPGGLLPRLRLRLHPLLFLFTNVRAMLGPAPGHHG
jgi:hypothetical protein